MNPRSVFTLFIWLLLASLSTGPLAEPASERNLTFTIDSFYSQPIYDKHPARDRMRVALANLGYTYSLRYIKGPRALAMANSGDVDGEFARNRDHTSEFPNLLFVPEPVNAVHTIIISRAELADEDRQWTSLAPRNRVVISGSRVGRKVPAQFADLPTIVAASYDQALKIVGSGRADMVIIPANFDFLTQQPDIEAQRLVALSPHLEEEAAYMHLHKRHQQLLAPLTAELKKLKYQTQFPE